MKTLKRSFAKKPGKTLAHQLATHVREYIFAHGFKPGDRLPGEHVLARLFKVSRPTLREAIKGLTVTGLLESKPRTGTRVREFSYNQVVDTLVNHFYLGDRRGLHEILEARAALELAVLPLALQRMTPERLKELSAIEERFEAAVKVQTGYNEIDLKFHEALLSSSDNQLLTGMVGLLRAFFAHPLHADLIVARHFDADEQALTIAEHCGIINALTTHDIDSAAATLREHFDRQIRWLEAEGNHGAEPEPPDEASRRR